METLAQREQAISEQAPKLSRKLQVQMTEDAYLRLHHAAKRAGVSAGRILSALVEGNLPPVGRAA